MTIDQKIVDDLLSAAEAIAYAREQDMETCEEWDALNRAVLAASEEAGSVRFEFTRGEFVRKFSMRGGETDDRACDAEDLDQIAHAIEEKGSDWFTVDEVARDTQRDWIVAFIAIEFLRRTKLVIDEATGHRIIAAEAFAADVAIGMFGEALEASERK